MNSSGFEANWNYDLFVKNHEAEGQKDGVFLKPEKSDGSLKYEVTSHLDEDIADYAFHRLKEIAQKFVKTANWDERGKLKKIADLVVADFDKIHQKRGNLAKIVNHILVRLNIRHSEQEIRILHRAIKTPTLGDKVSPYTAPQLIQEHRHPKQNHESYDKVALTGVFFEARFKELLQEHNDILKTLKEPQLSIFRAGLKERAIKEIYQKELPKRIQEGYYNPAVIPREIDRILGPTIKMPRTKLTDEMLHQWLKNEVDRYGKHLSEHQVNYIKKDVIEAVSLYLKAYPDKTHRNAYVLGRDLIRLAVYQEIFDKASFTGSDHGSKHIHHNIENADALLRNMQQKVDYSDKDRFIEHLIHFYHDIGYTVGLAGNSFSCCKDHPLIGAKMIEENRDYFEHYLDKESADILWNGVLLHAIAMPNLTPDKHVVAGMFPNMIRAVVSISDACAVTYDRKTQEFWEQPATLLALARLRLFLTMYPQYISKLSQSGQTEWNQLDQNNPMDVLAHDIYRHTKRILFKAVDQYDVPPEKKELFRQAIVQQFNSFTTATTLGQFGGVLTGVSAVKNQDQIRNVPKFFPQFDLAPSIIYETLYDLFGEELAQASFKKLVDEFSGDLRELSKEINETARKMSHHEFSSSVSIKTGNACFKIHGHYDVDPNNKHFSHMQMSLYQVMVKIESIYRGKLVPLSEKNKVIQELMLFRQGKSKKCAAFSDFVTVYVIPNLRVHQPSDAIKDIELLTRIVKEDLFNEIHQADALWMKILAPLDNSAFQSLKGNIDKFKGELEKLKSGLVDPKNAAKIEELRAALLASASGHVYEKRFLETVNELFENLRKNTAVFQSAEKRYAAIENAVKLILVSEEEYRFMRGRKATVSKSDCIVQLLHA